MWFQEQVCDTDHYICPYYTSGSLMQSFEGSCLPVWAVGLCIFSHTCLQISFFCLQASQILLTDTWFFSSQEQHWHGLCLTERVFQGGLESASISLLLCISTGCFPCNSWHEWIWDKPTRILTPASEATGTQTLTPWQRLSGLLSNSPSVWCGWRQSLLNLSLLSKYRSDRD